MVQHVTSHYSPQDAWIKMERFYKGKSKGLFCFLVLRVSSPLIYFDF